MHLITYINADTCIQRFRVLTHTQAPTSAWLYMALAYDRLSAFLIVMWWQDARLLMTRALCYYDWKDLVFNGCHMPSNIKKLTISKLTDHFVFALPEATGWMHVWTGACSGKKLSLCITVRTSQEGDKISALATKAYSQPSVLTWQRWRIFSWRSANFILHVQHVCVLVCLCACLLASTDSRRTTNAETTIQNFIKLCRTNLQP